jgi:alpha-amylase
MHDGRSHGGRRFRYVSRGVCRTIPAPRMMCLAPWPTRWTSDLMLAYAFILTEGYPCVFWQDYYGWRLGREGNRSGIAVLVKVHESHAGGSTAVLHVDDDLNVMQRNGSGNQQGLIFVLNNRGDRWSGARVLTRWRNTRLLIPA